MDWRDAFRTRNDYDTMWVLVKIIYQEWLAIKDSVFSVKPLNFKNNVVGSQSASSINIDVGGMWEVRVL